MSDNIFAEEWRDCLREHFKETVRNNDTITLRTLTGVMLEVGFGEKEIEELKILAKVNQQW